MSRPLSSFLKENAVLIAGITLPLMLIVLFTVARWLPAKNVPDPQYRAVYAIQAYYNGTYSFKVNDDGKLQVEFNSPAASDNYVSSDQKSSLYIFDAAKNVTEEIKLELPKAEKEKKTFPIKVSKFDTLTLAAGDSPDGYKFRDESYSGSSLITELFTYRSRRTPRALVKDGRDIPIENQGNYGNFTFIGWVTKE